MFSGFRLRLSTSILFVLSCCMLGVAEEPKLGKLLQRSPLPANAMCYLHTPSLKKLLADPNVTLELADRVEEVWLVSELDIENLKPVWEATRRAANVFRLTHSGIPI